MFSVATGILSGLTSIAGGLKQAEQIRIATERRLQAMRLQRDQAVGQATAVAGATGVEMTSSTIQDHLTQLEAEWNRRISDLQSAGQVAEGNSMMSAFGGGVSNFLSGLAPAYEAQARGLDPFESQKKPTNPFDFWSAKLSPGGSHEGWS